MSENKQVYKISFLNEGKVFEIYAKRVSQGGLFGFVEVEQLLFGQKTSVVVDPSEETLRTAFEGVRRTYIPLHSVIRIDEVEKRGAGKIHDLSDRDGKIHQLPTTIYTPVKKDS